ncbi:dihydroorotase [Marinobacter bryozoorum]|jgi:dihydroorotase|uniref:dihydroorotase n=1 Tax=Marinobacter bryozoorum TaxID=256324 RepID=UPI0020041740|nr:dihydroorotase [Marinobacter bryozoorum]MCK7544333.1 dihydroorotase [Marinobacter bryozoorum]
MSTSLRIDNARLADGTAINLLARDGLIQAMGAEPVTGSAETVIDASGLTLLPGFVDLCCNLREPGNGQKGNIASETRAAARGGFTTVCASPDTSPVNDSGAVTNLIRDVARSSAAIRVLPVGAATRGLAGELLSDMVGLSNAGCVAFSNGTRAMANARILRRCMAYARTFDLTLMLQPLNDALAADGYAHDGKVAAHLGLLGVPEVAETASVMEMLLLAEETGVRLHLGQLSCARSVEMVADARQRGVSVTADVAMHQLVFTEEALSGFDSRYHVLPPLRTEADRKALLKGVEAGVIDAIVSQHQPHDSAAKQAPLGVTEPGMSTIESVFSMGLGLVQQGELSLAALLRALTAGPAGVVGAVSELKQGGEASLSLWDLEGQWHATPGNIQSRGAHVPVPGRPLSGVPHWTVAEGRVVYRLD